MRAMKKWIKNVGLFLASAVVAAGAAEAKGPCVCGVAPERASDFYWENDRVGFRAYGPGDYHLWSGIDVFNKGHDRVEVETLLRRGAKGQFGNWHTLAAVTGGLRAFDNYAVGAGRGVGGVAFFGDGEWKTYPNWETCEVHETSGDAISFTLVYPAFSAAGKMTCRVTMRTGEPFFRNEVTFEKDEFAAMGFRAGPGLDVNPKRGHDGDLFESQELGVVSLFENPKQDAKGNDEGSTMTAIFVEDPSAVEFLTDHMGCRVLAFKKRSFVYWAGASWSGRGEFTTPKAWHDFVVAFRKTNAGR